jgi:heat shock protein HslJ
MSENENQSNNSNILMIVLAVALIGALVVIGVLVVALLLGGRGDGNSDSEVAEPTAPPPGVTVIPTDPVQATQPPQSTAPPVILPTPEPQDPVAVVIAPDGVNLRSGPGTDYNILGAAAFGTSGEVIGRSQDNLWWVINVPGVAGNQGWAFSAYVDVTNADNVPVIPNPPTPTPLATATATPTPGPEIAFSATQTTLNAGDVTVLSWNVQNVQAVYVYPVGANFQNFPVTGVGSKQVQPFVNTTYELRVVKTDNATELRQINITVNGGLHSGRWVLQAYDSGGGALVQVLPGTEISATFNPDGSVSGSGGCNTFTATHQAYEAVLLVTGLTSTQVSCELPQGIMQQETSFFSLLDASGSFAVFGNQLSIRDAGGQTILSFIRG